MDNIGIEKQGLIEKILDIVDQLPKEKQQIFDSARAEKIGEQQS